MTLTVSVGGALGAEPRALMRRLAAYRGTDLGHGRLWRLMFSAFAAQSALQLAWTMLMMVMVFVAAERRIGSRALVLITLAAHALSTIVVDVSAYLGGWRSWLAQPDYGTSCLIMSAIMIMVLATRAKALVLSLALLMVGDGLTHAASTVLEHLVALAVAATAYGWHQRREQQRHNRTADTDQHTLVRAA